MRVYDAVMLAGGFAAGADASTVNLAQTVRDEMMIVIPFVSTSSPDEEDPADVDEESGKININTATVEELDRLYGIGYILAQRIIDYRAEYGAFESIEDIMKVDGIKETVYEAIKDDICV
ncbi:MAG: helix-hairpin-helix domain-containing protein [Bacillus subtilis]|nr:helix-hairpin-helix domain-containing protein [Bacillus subtilis]